MKLYKQCKLSVRPSDLPSSRERTRKFCSVNLEPTVCAIQNKTHAKPDHLPSRVNNATINAAVLWSRFRSSQHLLTNFNCPHCNRRRETRECDATSAEQTLNGQREAQVSAKSIYKLTTYYHWMDPTQSCWVQHTVWSLREILAQSKLDFQSQIDCSQTLTSHG